MSKIQSEDLILINREGVDYQAKVSDLPGGDSGGGGGGGGGLDDILNAPVVKEIKYQIWEDAKNQFQPMVLIDGDGGNGSTWKALTPRLQEGYLNQQGQCSIDAFIQYASSYNTNFDYVSSCMASVNNLVVTAVGLDDPTEDYSDRVSTNSEHGYFHSHGTQKSGNYQPDTTDYKLVLTFDDIHGEETVLYVEVQLLVYVAMRREDIDLREMEALDAELKDAGEEAADKSN